MFSRLTAAEHVVVTVNAVAGAVMVTPIDTTACAGVDTLSPAALPQGCARALGSVTAAAESSSVALRAVEGPLLQDVMFGVLPPITTVPIGSGHRILTEAVLCDQACRDRFAALRKAVQASKRQTASLTPLSVLNAQLVDGGASGPISMVKLDMREMSFGARSQQVLAESLRTVGGGGGSSAVEMEQVSLLAKNKLLHGLSYHQASLSKQANEVQLELLGYLATQALQTITSLSDPAAQLAIAQEFFDVKLRFYGNVALQQLHQSVRAFDYLFLTDYTGLDFSRCAAAIALPAQRLPMLLLRHVVTDNARSRPRGAGTTWAGWLQGLPLRFQ